MNAYYNFEGTRFNTRAIGTVQRKNKTSIYDKFISFVCAIVAMLTCPVAVMLEKAAAATVLMFLFFGVIGGMETQLISLGLGLVLCLGICLVEFFIFKSMGKKAVEKK